MIIDPRIYESILVPLAVVLFVLCMAGAGTIDNLGLQRRLVKVVLAGMCFGGALTIVFWLDWLWA